MQRTRIKLGVYMDLDPVLGTFHSAESAQHQVRNTLMQQIPHYNPSVSIDSYDTADQHGESEKVVYVVFFCNPDSYHSTRQFLAVAESVAAARDWIEEYTTTGSQHAKGPQYDVEFWLKYGYSIEPKPFAQIGS